MAGPGRVVVVGLGPAGPDLLTVGSRRLLEEATHRFLRTTRHPAAEPFVAGSVSFDSVYETAGTMDEVYRTIVDRLVAEAGRVGQVTYAVPGSPAVAEHTVELLREAAAAGLVEIEVHGSLSFLDLAWVRLGIDPVAVGVRVVDGHRFAVEAAGERGPLLVAQCDSASVLSDVKLAVDPWPDEPVVVLQRLGLPEESVTEVAWADLDRVAADHLTSIYLPVLAAPVAAELTRFAEQVRVLRERCPWDRRQTHASLVKYLLEETYEVAEAIDGLGPAAANSGDDDDPDEGGAGGVAGAEDADADAVDALEEELGDLLFQVVFHATIAAQSGWFDLADVARGIHDKLERRHPHVFGSVEAGTAEEVSANWDAIKAAEKGRSGVFDGVVGALPALLYAHEVQRRAAKVGFDWPSVEGAWPKVAEEAAELRAAPDDAGELGDLLFAVVNVARHLGHDPEAALRGAAAKFRRRFEQVEALAAGRGIDLASSDLAGLDALWDEVKGGEGSSTRPEEKT